MSEKRLGIGGGGATALANARVNQQRLQNPAGQPGVGQTGKVGNAGSTPAVAEPVQKKTPTTTTDHVSSTPLIPAAHKKDVLSAAQATAVVKELTRSFDCTDERQLMRRLSALTNIADIAPGLPGGLASLGVPMLDKRPLIPALSLPAVDGAVGGVRAALVGAYGPMGDLFYGADAKSLQQRSGDVKEAATQVKQFRADLTGAKNLDDILAVAKQWRDEPLPAQCRNELMKSMMDQASGKDIKPFEAAAAWYKDSILRHPTHAADEIGREFFLVCLNKAGRLEESILEGRSYIRSMAQTTDFKPSLEVVRGAPQVNGEVLAGLGKAFKLVEESIKKGTPLTPKLQEAIETELGLKEKAPPGFDYAKAALEVSTRYYEAGFAQDFEYYPGIVSVYNNYEKGDSQRAERLAPMVWQACERAGGKEASDYWCLSTQTELSLILNKHSDLLELLPSMLGRADVGWKLESTVSKMTTLCAARDAAGQDTRALHHVIGALNERIEALGAHATAKKAPGADAKALDAAFAKTTTKWIGDTTGALQKKLGARAAGDVEDPAEAAAAAITKKVMTSTADFRALTSSHAVGGNVAYGGQIPDMTITRHSVRVVRELVQTWGLDKIDNVEEFNKAINEKLNVMLGLQDANGRRPLEDLHSAEHKILDAFDKNRFPLAGTEVSGDSRTDLLALLGLGIGDCRPTAYAKQLFFDVWQHDAVNHKLGAALQASTNGDTKTYEKKLAEADKLQRTMLRTVTVLIEAPIQMNKMYEWATDPKDPKHRPLRDADGKYQQVENHTFNVLVELDEKGNVKEDMRAADGFYHQLYPLDGLPLSASGLVNGGVWQHDTMGTQASDGKDVPFRMTPTVYSGALLKDFEVGSCDFKFCGQNVAPLTVASITQERGRLNGLAQQIAALQV